MQTRERIVFACNVLLLLFAILLGTGLFVKLVIMLGGLPSPP
jgi:hypothetical protein